MDLASHVLAEFAKGLVVFRAAASPRLLWPPKTLSLYIFTCLGHTAKLTIFLARLLCLMKCFLTSVSSSALGSIVFDTAIDFWHFQHCGLHSFFIRWTKYGWMMLFSIKVSLLKRAPKTMSTRFCRHGPSTSAQCEYLGMVQVSCPALIHRTLPCNVA